MIKGYVERIVYRNEENAYCVVEVSSEDDELVLVGTFPSIEEGNFIEAEGTTRVHPTYGEQLVVSEYRITRPDNEISIMKYLSSGAIKGIGSALASKIIRKFGSDSLRVLEEEPERLAEVKGISMRKAMEISAQVEEKKDLRDAMMFLAEYGVPMNLALKIYRIYGSTLYRVLKENPYQLARDIDGVGFRIADDLARKIGVPADSQFRIGSALLYLLSGAAARGHMYLPEEELLDECSRMLEIPVDRMPEELDNLRMEKKIIVQKTPEGNAIYPASAFYVEQNTAQLLLALHRANPVRIITGGPGTGKTTNIRNMIAECEKAGLEVVLAAPTGRAAKRMEEATGHPAGTIHRLLGAAGKPEGDDDVTLRGVHFAKDESDPLEADVVIIDEMSMVDIYLMYALLRAIVPGTKLVLVGDTNQLPSVGPGNVLRDLIDSDRFEVLRLNRNYRQEAGSDIIVNAHRMIHREEIDLDKRSEDFLFVRRPDPDRIIAAMLTLVREKLPDYVHTDPFQIQIMTPMKKGALGVERLNPILQESLNPPGKGKTETELAGRTWREGDKVMQIRNNYEKNVYNGDMGILQEINLFAETLTVNYDGREVEYPFSDVEELEHAYAITVHKSQGSEYPAVILPLHRGPQMLMTRNLLYTAVTRARRCVCLVGVPETFREMAANTTELRRYSGLTQQLHDL